MPGAFPLLWDAPYDVRIVLASSAALGAFVPQAANDVAAEAAACQPSEHFHLRRLRVDQRRFFLHLFHALSSDTCCAALLSMNNAVAFSIFMSLSIMLPSLIVLKKML